MNRMISELLGWCVILFAFNVAAGIAQPAAMAQGPEAAVIRIPSHGCSATVIKTEPGRTLILTCAHAFQGEDRTKPIKLDVPHPAPGPNKAGVKKTILKIGNPDGDDLVLIQLDDGPLPYSCPVAPAGTRPRSCLSIGYSEMKWPAEQRPVRVNQDDGTMFWTQGQPIPGQSGGALVDRETNQLVGVVHGFTLDARRNGLFVDLATIRRFLGDGSPRQAPQGAPMARGPQTDPRYAPGPSPGVRDFSNPFPGVRQFITPRQWPGSPGCPT